MEIDITDLFQALAETNLMLFSASPAEMGEDAGSHTWANCMDRADPEEDGYIALLDDEDKLTALRDHCRSFGAWIYDCLESEHSWLTSDEQVDESIRANEYTFNEDGGWEG